MDWFNQADWHTLFVPTVPLMEIMVRGTLVYLALFFMLRIILKRQAGTVGITDLLVVVLIADAAQNAMSADYRSVPDGILLVATIIFWSALLDWLGYRYRWIGKFVHPPPLKLIDKGKCIERNMRKEFISKEELHSCLREQGVQHLADVKAAYMEGNGHISIIKYDQTQHKPQKKPIT